MPKIILFLLNYCVQFGFLLQIHFCKGTGCPKKNARLRLEAYNSSLGAAIGTWKTIFGFLRFSAFFEPKKSQILYIELWENHILSFMYQILDFLGSNESWGPWEIQKCPNNSFQAGVNSL